MLSAISVPETTDSLYAGAPATQFTRTPPNIHIIYTNNTEMYSYRIEFYKS